MLTLMYGSKCLIAWSRRELEMFLFSRLPLNGLFPSKGAYFVSMTTPNHSLMELFFIQKCGIVPLISK